MYHFEISYWFFNFKGVNKEQKLEFILAIWRQKQLTFFKTDKLYVVPYLEKTSYDHLYTCVISRITKVPSLTNLKHQEEALMWKFMSSFFYKKKKRENKNKNTYLKKL